VFRTCDAFRVEKLFLCGITATPPHREIHKTALGAEESVKWKYLGSASEAILELKKSDYLVSGHGTYNSSCHSRIMKFLRAAKLHWSLAMKFREWVKKL